jgi:hypothetical protein
VDIATLASYATPRQLEYLEKYEELKSFQKVADFFGVDKAVPHRALAAIRKKAALQGYSPGHDMVHTVPDGFKVKGVSTYYDEEGKPRGQWIKSQADEQRRQELIQAAYDAMAAELPRVVLSEKPSHTSDKLATLYTLTDSHVGMLAWSKETGADWDLKIAEATLVGCFKQMVESSPPSKVGVVNQLGDFLHYDSLSPVTPTSGHVVDADGRFSKMVESAVRILRSVVDMALIRHEKVVVLMAEGNHDMASSVWLRIMFKALYENEPRIEVIDSPLPYYVYQHGKTMLAFHHGHLKKNDQLPILFASQFPEVWGATTKRYAHTGHRHHVEEREHSGITVVQHPTLAARDAYAARGGWIAERQVKAITYHSQHGEVGRVTVTPEMIDGAP